MKFLYPEFLWALSLIAIPIIIHLFNFRKFKKIFYSDISLLEAVQIKTKSRSRLKHLLILISRILAISTLVIAFCYPFKPSLNDFSNASIKTVSVYIDNSLSMDIKGPDGFFLELAKQQAINIANEYAPDVRFFMLTNDFMSQSQRDLSRNEFIDLVMNIKASPYEKDLGSIYTRQSDILRSFNTKKDISYLFTPSI